MCRIFRGRWNPTIKETPNKPSFIPVATTTPVNNKKPIPQKPQKKKWVYSSEIILLQAFFRVQLSKNKLNKARKQVAKRNNIVQEILSTERSYVTNLRILTGVRK